MAVNGKPYLLSPIIFEMDKGCKKTLAAGDEWGLGNGYSLVVTRIDLGANEVRLSLFKNSAEVASSVIQLHETGDWFGNCMYISGFPGAYTVKMWDVPTTSTFVYQEDVGYEADVPIFSVYVNAIFCGTETNLTQLKYAMLIDDDLINVIETGAGMMKAEMVTPESVRLVNNKRIKLYMDSDTRIAEDLRIHVADDRDGNGVANYRYYPYVNRACPAPDPEPTPTPIPPTPYPADGPDEIQIRGEVVNLTGAQNEDILWSASNFAGFWYDLDEDLGMESLTIMAGALNNHINDRTIDEGALVYTTHPEFHEYELYKEEGLTVESANDGGDTGYWIEGWLAEAYVAIDGRADKLCMPRVEFEDDDKKTLSTGEGWDIGGGFTLTADKINLEGDEVWFSLCKDGKEIDNELVSTNGTQQDRVYTYTQDIGGEEAIPVFSCYVAAIFRGTDSNIVQVKYVFLIDNDVIKIDSGDEFGIMEATASPSKIILKNKEPTIDLDIGTKERIMGDMYFITADDDSAIRFYPMDEYTEPGTYEVRGTVVEPDAANLPSGTDLVWDYNNFAGFWYGLDDDLATETLTINRSAISFPYDRVLDEGTVVYETYPVYWEYELHKDLGLTVESGHPGGDCGYYLEGFMADEYVAIDNNADKLCRLLVEFEDDDKKTLATGEGWYLGGGFVLVPNQIDLEGDKVWFSIYKDDKELDSEVISCSSGVDHQDNVYTYTVDIGGEDEVPVFTCYVDAIFRGADSNIVQVMYVFLIDDAVLEIDTGDEFGRMEVVTASSAGITLRNDETLDLDAGTTEQIMDDVYFRIADNDTVRFYPFVERTIRGSVPEPEEPEEDPILDTDGDGVPDLRDKEPDTPRGYWVNSDGRGRKWGDMNGDDKLTSADALMLLQAAAGKIDL